MKNINEVPQKVWANDIRDPELFVKEFGAHSDEAWFAALNAAERGETRLPLYPDTETMRWIHGSPTVESALREAFLFYQFVRAHRAMAGFDWKKARLLDFGCGWGRISRFYLRDLPVSRIDGFEPNLAFAVLARRLNPFITIHNGDFTPDGTLRADRYDLIVGWSIFSHLSRHSAIAWFAELWRVARPGARLFLTTWGERFIKRLIDAKAKMAMGGSADWYTQDCVERGGDLEKRLDDFRSGKFVFIGYETQLYGEAMLSASMLAEFLAAAKAPFEIVEVDVQSLSQDVIILRKPDGAV
jgi:2-polyprenyl-3-methyl-5-hydroxy-6-metoxy-1,4-benzoquinol methylase